MTSNFYRDRAEIIKRRDSFIPEANGMSAAELEPELRRIIAENPSRTTAKARMLEFLFGNARLEVAPCDIFVGRIDHGELITKIRGEWTRVYRESFPELFREGDIANSHGAWSGFDDFGHTCPDWESILSLGVPGLIARLEAARESAEDEHELEFLDSCLIVYRAFVRLLGRFAETADSLGCTDMALNLRRNAERAPESMYEAMQLISLFYHIQTSVEGENVRSLGRLDKLLAPYFTASEADRELFRYFLTRFDDRGLGANIPFTLGGGDIADDKRCEQFDICLLEEYAALDIPSPKMQIRVADNTSDALINKVCELIRSGSSSFVFCFDRTIRAGFERLGHLPKDAENYVLIGCYEPGSMGLEVPCTCNGRVSLAKAVECALNGGRDLRDDTLLGVECPLEFDSFEEFLAAAKVQGIHFAERSMARTAAQEKYYPEINPSPFMSGAMACCVENRRDAYEGGAKYNFSSVNVFGLASAADSLYAVKKLVFDDKQLTLAELRELLRSNWKNDELMRLVADKRLAKFGCGEACVDSIAREFMSAVADSINGRPNGRGGFFRAGAFSIDWRFDYGRRSAASASGRLEGETLSKNLSASDSCDRNGVTGMMLSAASLDNVGLVNGAVLDLVLHKSAVSGDDGIDAMRSLVRTYDKLGGHSLQFNILDPSVLRAAQVDPEKYSNIQIRLCGWNVYFTRLTRTEQDEFIRSCAE